MFACSETAKVKITLKYSFTHQFKMNKQAQEIEAVSATFGYHWKREDTNKFSINIVENKKKAVLYVTMPSDYPSTSPPTYELSAPWMERKAKSNLHRILDEAYLNDTGKTIPIEWVERIRETLMGMKEGIENTKNNKIKIELSKLETSCPTIIHGPVIVDRKSCFQGHAATVTSVEEVNLVLTKLKQNNKISNAKHNMFAYRIEKSTSKGTTLIQDYDEDGEAHAGGRMLHLMQKLDQRNAVVIVTRWYGGVHLGPDRFRHINNASMRVLQQAGLLKK